MWKTVELKRTKTRETYHRLKVQRLENKIKTPDDNDRTMEIEIECLKKENFRVKKTNDDHVI